MKSIYEKALRAPPAVTWLTVYRRLTVARRAIPTARASGCFGRLGLCGFVEVFKCFSIMIAPYFIIETLCPANKNIQKKLYQTEIT